MRRRLALVALLMATALALSLAPAVAEETAIPPGYPGDGPYWDPLPAFDAIRPSVVGLVVELAPLVSDGKARLAGGTGVVYKQGYVVTNAHVVQGAVRVRLLLPGGGLALTQQDQIWVDTVSDIAVLRFRAVTLPVPVWADSDRIKSGQMVVAVGNPLGFRLGNTATVGVISGAARTVAPGYPARSWGNDPPLLQTDTPINPGNSGGPLVNANGEVLGLAQSKLADLGVEGMGFALPSNLVRQVADQLIASGQMVWPWLGAELEEHVDAAQSGQAADGLLVYRVARGGPADGKLQPRDRVLAVGGTAVATLDDLNRALAGKGVGTPVALRVRRADQELDVNAVLAERPGLYLLPEDTAIWSPMSFDQTLAAADWAMANRKVSLDVLSLPYQASAPLGNALLRTEFLHVAHTVYESLAAGQPLSDSAIFQTAGPVQELLLLEVAVRTQPADLPLKAEMTQRRRTTPGRLAQLPSGQPDRWVATGVPADASRPDLTRAVFSFTSPLVWSNVPVTVVVRSAVGTELARFEWDLSEIR